MMKMITIRNQSVRVTALLIISFLFCGYVIAQDHTNVLQEEGRDELFHDYLISVVDSLDIRRKAELENALNDIKFFRLRQERLKTSYLELLGDFPERTPLRPRIARTLKVEDYYIDVLSYQSRPNHTVTANFYYPATGEKRYPGILLTVGHYPGGKNAGLLQKLCISLVKNGFAVLIVDPVCQGERYQIISPKTGKLAFVGESGTKQNTRLDVGAMLTGTSVVSYILWDNYRGIDYLCSRPEVDTSRIGVTGSSGGGTQATYLAAYDSRIDVAAVTSYIMNEPGLYKTIGPQTGSQNLSYEGYYGIDHPEYITMFAPKPFMILGAVQDFFDIHATRETFKECKRVYNKLGAPEKIGYFEYDDGHGYSQPRREAATKWFRTWFYNDSAEVREPKDMKIQSVSALQYTKSGQIFYDNENEIVVEKMNLERARTFSGEREKFWAEQSRDSCLSKVRELIRWEEPETDMQATIRGVIDRGSYRIEKTELIAGNLVSVTGLLFIPDHISENAETVLYVDGQGKGKDAGRGGYIEKTWVNTGKIVFAIDVRGFGETEDNPDKNETKHGNREHRNAVISGYVGKTLIGQRVQDINLAKNYLLLKRGVTTSHLVLYSNDRAGSAVLHAAALDTDYDKVTLRGWNYKSWIDMIKKPTELNNMTHVVPGALKFYDLSDLVKAISPRQVLFIED